MNRREFLKAALASSAMAAASPSVVAFAESLKDTDFKLRKAAIVDVEEIGWRTVYLYTCAWVPAHNGYEQELFTLSYRFYGDVPEEFENKVLADEWARIALPDLHRAGCVASVHGIPASGMVGRILYK